MTFEDMILSIRFLFDLLGFVSHAEWEELNSIRLSFLQNYYSTLARLVC